MATCGIINGIAHAVVVCFAVIGFEMHYMEGNGTQVAVLLIVSDLDCGVDSSRHGLKKARHKSS